MPANSARKAQIKPAPERVADDPSDSQLLLDRSLGVLPKPRPKSSPRTDPGLATNLLYYGDNLDILRRYIPADSIDLVYLDPPFNSDRNYNVIFKDESGRQSDAQLLAFEDTWHWGPNAEQVFTYLTNTARHQGQVPDSVSNIIAALRKGIGTNQMMAYLVEMAVRLVELRRVLKSTGSVWLHCDPNASHYLRLLLDAIFGPENFRNEVVWRRTNAHSDAKRFGRVHDCLLFYAMSATAVWNGVTIPYDPRYIAAYYRYKDPDGRRWRSGDATAPGGRGPRYEWHGHVRNWRYTKGNMEALEAQGKLYYTPAGIVRVKHYLDEAAGMPAQDVWDDESVRYIVSWSNEGVGYPTQKPLGLLERIIQVSCNPGDVVLDPFCGCGTALIAAQNLQRRWIGIDITYLAIAVMKARLKDNFGLESVDVRGQPTEVDGARALAQSPEGRYQFQWWALNLVDAQPVGGKEKKGADRGIDGVINFTDKLGALQTVLVSVKSGHVNSGMVRDLKGAMQAEKAIMGLFITLEEPSKEMKLAADSAGVFHSEIWNRDYPNIQILSIRELLQGKKPEMPQFVRPRAQRAVKREAAGQQQELFG